MGWFEGMLGGFTERKGDIEAENIRRSEVASAREARVYETLLSSPDPEIQALAVTGLLESAQPKKRKGGLRGWLGELETSPTFTRLQEMIATPVLETPAQPARPGTPPTLPSREIQPQAVRSIPRLGEAPAGTPATSLTEPHAPPAPAVSYREVPATVGTPPTPAQPATYRARRVFRTPEEEEELKYSARERGEIFGVAGAYEAAFVQQGMDPAQAKKQALDLAIEERRRARGGTGAPFQSIFGEAQDERGVWYPTTATFNRISGAYEDLAGNPLTNFRRSTTTGSTTLGAEREALARELFGQPASSLTPDQMAVINRRLPERAGEMAYGRGMGAGRASIATELDKPIGPTAAQQYNVSPTTTLRELSGMVGLRPEQQEKITSLTQIDLLIQEIDRNLPLVFPNVPQGIRGAIQTNLSLMAQRLGRDPDLATLDASINAALAQIAQLSGQPGSRLSDRDIELARSTLANLQPGLFQGDTLATAQARLNVIKDLFRKAQEGVVVQRGAPAAVATPPPGAPGTGPAGYTMDPDGKLYFNGKPVGQ